MNTENPYFVYFCSVVVAVGMVFSLMNLGQIQQDTNKQRIIDNQKHSKPFLGTWQSHDKKQQFRLSWEGDLFLFWQDNKPFHAYYYPDRIVVPRGKDHVGLEILPVSKNKLIMIGKASFSKVNQ